MRPKPKHSAPPADTQSPRDAHDLRMGSANPDAPLEDVFTVEPRGDARTMLGVEWLLTDGLGGYAMGTALGAPTRRWHALLVGATNPPVGRMCAWNATVDTLTLGGGDGAAHRVDLSTFRFDENTLHPDGHARLVRFERRGLRAQDEPSCRWVWREGGAEVTRTLSMLWKTGGARLVYTALAPSRAAVRIAPLVSLRSAQDLIRRGDGLGVERVDESCVIVRRGGLALRLRAEGARFEHAPDWWTNFRYDKERERQYDCVEDLFTPGAFVLEAAAGVEARCEIVGTLGRDGVFPDERRARTRRVHMAGVVRAAETRGYTALSALACAADDFVVERTVDGVRGATIIAGYPWFADWGRDAMIALPGLLLTTGRYDEALSALNTFGAHVRNGLVPNCYDERTGEPHYNSVDASLWFLRAACEFGAATSGHGAPTLPDGLLTRCFDIVDNFIRGTDFNIGVDERDGLLYAGDEHTQLTWMDAKRDGVVFTPRFGKCVELNALWVHCLRALAGLGNAGARARRDELLRRADDAAGSFSRLFWRERLGCLADRLAPEGRTGETSEGVRWVPVDEVRPNQLFAAALERSPLTLAQRRAVVACARERLLTPRGVRTLAPGSPGYRARYEGSMFERDGAYHNGTAWPWLIGAYCEGALRAGGFDGASREEARRALAPIMASVREGCIGQIGEVADAEGTPDAPQREDGCPAQAWSVAEALRIAALLAK